MIIQVNIYIENNSIGNSKQRSDIWILWTSK